MDTTVASAPGLLLVQECALERLEDSAPVSGDASLSVSPKHLVRLWGDEEEKDVDGFRHQYEMLSEFSHPNWAGTALLYSRPDPPNLRTDFGANIRGGDSTKHAGVLNLSVALMFFERSYNHVADVMPAFITLCASRLKLGGTGEMGDTA